MIYKHKGTLVTLQTIQIVEQWEYGQEKHILIKAMKLTAMILTTRALIRMIFI